ncbi:MAG: hypothetical protein ACLSAP_12245 [Oscillospiraceae bacterium]
MKKLQKVVCSALVAGALLCQSLLPGFAAVSTLESVTNIHEAYTNSSLLSSVHILKEADRIYTSDFSAVLEPGEYIGISFREIRNVSEVEVKNQGDAYWVLDECKLTPLTEPSGEPVAMGYIRLVNRSDSPDLPAVYADHHQLRHRRAAAHRLLNGGSFPIYSGSIQISAMAIRTRCSSPKAIRRLALGIRWIAARR